jgi:hypothetical protein
MRLPLLALTLLALSSLVAQAQDNNIVQQPKGRITATIFNDEGEPVKEAIVCIFIRRPKDSSIRCGSVTDKNGEVEIEQVNMGKVGLYAESALRGYWEEDEKRPTAQTVTLTSAEPHVHVTLNIGPRPGVLNLSLRDKETGKFVWTATIHLSSTTRNLGSSGTGNYEKSESSELRVPIRPATDVMLEVSAPGYKKWLYTDPANPSQPTLRLNSGEQRSIAVEMEPEPKDAAEAHKALKPKRPR